MRIVISLAWIWLFLKHFSTWMYKYKDCSKIRLLLHQPKRLKVASNCQRWNVSNFNGFILNWNTFWQQFNVAIHSKAQSDDTQKLAYLRDALKDGPVRHAIESLTHDAEGYKEAIDCFRKRYDQLHVTSNSHLCHCWCSFFNGWQQQRAVTSLQCCQATSACSEGNEIWYIGLIRNINIGAQIRSSHDVRVATAHSEF